ncbi:unnamed protein product [Vicia faba]|uniref:Uncharacterized protein n=1 Tax=Vicia faba TaxID=3906 RepID=A0AAV1AWZ5_VICFA|nr:unnamed protein product [Vicia faba]
MTQISRNSNQLLGFKSEPRNAVVLQLLERIWNRIPCLRGGNGKIQKEHASLANSNGSVGDIGTGVTVGVVAWHRQKQESRDPSFFFRVYLYKVSFLENIKGSHMAYFGVQDSSVGIQIRIIYPSFQPHTAQLCTEDFRREPKKISDHSHTNSSKKNASKFQTNQYYQTQPKHTKPSKTKTLNR